MQNKLNDIKNYWEAVQRRKWLVILPVAVCTAVSIFSAATLPSYYRSTTTILVEQQQIPEEYVTPTNRTPFGQRLQTIRQQILSRPNLAKIINDFQLYQNLGRGLVSSILSKAGLMSSDDAPTKEDVYEQMSKDIEVSVIGGQRGDAFSISFTGTDPETTMQVTSTIASLFIEENLKVREEYAEGTSEFLTHELENAKTELENQERAVQNFKEKHMGGLPQQLETNLRALDRLQQEIQNVRVDIKSAEDRKILLEAQLNQTVSGTVQTPGVVVVDPLAAELARLQQDLSALLANYKENYPDVISTRRRINELKELLSKPKAAQPHEDRVDDITALSPEVRNPVAYNNLVTVKSQLAALRQREAEIIKQINFLNRRVEDTPAIEQKFTDLGRDYDISLRNYQALLEKKLHAKLSENLEKRQKGERFTIIDPANLPEKPFKPNRPVVALTGPLAGLGIGVGIVLLLEFLNPAFRTKEELADNISIPVLVTVPAFASSKPPKKNKLTFKPFKRSHGHT